MNKSIKEIPLFKVFMSEEAITKVNETLRSGFIGQGPIVEEFEKAITKFFKNDKVATMNSATSAEHLAIHMLKDSAKHSIFFGDDFYVSEWPGLQEGDEVLTTALTCTATNWPYLANGLKLKWVDIDPTTLNMDLDDLARKITPKTKIIMATHWGGYPMDLDKLAEIQTRAKNIIGFKPVVIEDCAHSLGSVYKNKLIGNHGNICTFSLQAIKHITSIDGGILVLPHNELVKRAKLLRWYGIDRNNNKKDFRCESDIAEWGFKFHMNDVNASIGLGNWKHINEIIKIHKDNAAYYDEALKNVSGVTLLKREIGHNSSFWIYSLLIDRRDEFAIKMKEYGIITSQVHERNDIHSCVKEFKSILPNLDKTIKHVTAIPVGHWITKEDREYIVDCIKKGW